MARLNLTLDPDTFRRLSEHAKRRGTRRAAFAREMLREALAQREAHERARKLAADYASGRRDARAVLADFEAPQLDLLADDERD